MPRRSSTNRERAIGRLQVGESVEQVSKALDVHPTTIYRLRNRFQATATTADRTRSGRPRGATPAHDRVIVRQHRRDPFLPAAETAHNTMGTTGRRLSRWTVPWYKRVAFRHSLCSYLNLRFFCTSVCFACKWKHCDLC